jgi:hypothetical protein
VGDDDRRPPPAIGSRLPGFAAHHVSGSSRR